MLVRRFANISPGRPNARRPRCRCLGVRHCRHSSTPSERALMIGLLLGLLAAQNPPGAETAPAATDPRLYRIAAAVPPAATEATIRKLVGFGTRHTLSDTVSPTHGIGAARRWIFDELTRISTQCGHCLEVQFDRGMVKAGPNTRVTKDVELVNVVAIQRGKRYPDRFVLITGHYDSRASDPNDATTDAPGASDDASGTAAVIEAARALSQYQFDKSIVYGALAGEEQGLLGGQQL